MIDPADLTRTEVALRAKIEQMLRFLNAHVPGFQNAFLIDTGMLGGDYYPGGTPAAVEFSGETVTAIYEDRREVLVGEGRLLVEGVSLAYEGDTPARQFEDRISARQH